MELLKKVIIVALKFALFCFFLGLVIEFLFSFGGRRGQMAHQAREKTCYTNMRFILGAVEMYNMDVKKENMIHFSMPDVTTDTGVLDGYIKAKISKPEPGCFYRIVGDISKPNGRIVCPVHGSVEPD
ncbi:MAG: hypothetical protein HQM10_21675 [Candidatus Riflebacteria bacterium]|nr:hypothetical protein [Candidatus Riflebacteria bacterium]